MARNRFDAGEWAGLLAIIACIAVGCAALYGWVENIIKLAHIVSDPVSGMLVLRAVGIFVAPLGAVLGFF